MNWPAPSPTARTQATVEASHGLPHWPTDRSASVHVEDALVRRYAAMVRRIVLRLAPRDAPIEDLLQAGTIGLLKAIRRYDAARGAPFEAFAHKHIIGETRHALRDGALCRRPEKRSALSRTVSATAAALCEELGREPRPAEIGARLHLNERDVVKIQRRYEPVYIRAAGDLLRGEPIDLPIAAEGKAGRPRPLVWNGPSVSQIPIEDRLSLCDLLRGLAEMEKKVVYYTYYLDLTQTQVALLLGLSQRQVSRVLARAKRRLALLLDAREN